MLFADASVGVKEQAAIHGASVIVAEIPDKCDLIWMEGPLKREEAPQCRQRKRGNTWRLRSTTIAAERTPLGQGTSWSES